MLSKPRAVKHLNVASFEFLQELELVILYNRIRFPIAAESNRELGVTEVLYAMPSQAAAAVVWI